MAASDIELDGREWNKSFTLSLYAMQETGQLCDTAISLEDEPLMAHACVLAAASPTLKVRARSPDGVAVIMMLDLKLRR